MWGCYVRTNSIRIFEFVLLKKLMSLFFCEVYYELAMHSSEHNIFEFVYNLKKHSQQVSSGCVELLLSASLLPEAAAFGCFSRF